MNEPGALLAVIFWCISSWSKDNLSKIVAIHGARLYHNRPYRTRYFIIKVDWEREPPGLESESIFEDRERDGHALRSKCKCAGYRSLREPCVSFVECHRT